MSGKDRLFRWNKLVSWRQRRCLRCQKFLAKRELRYCGKCRILIRYENRRRWQTKNRFGREGWISLVRK
jgi:ribosomal protein S27AE